MNRQTCMRVRRRHPQWVGSGTSSSVTVIRMSVHTAATTKPALNVIRPSRGWVSVDLPELWQYRELLLILTWRSIAVKYKQAFLGISWAVLQPLATMIIFTVIFGRFAKLPSDGIPSPLFTLAALLPWQLFSTALSNSGVSLVSNANLLTKVYFPRLLIPLSAILGGVIEFGISFILLMALMVVYRIPISWTILVLPFLMLYCLITALAVGIWVSAINVEYRDAQHILPFLVQIWLYASPVAYSASLVPRGMWRLIYGLNPMSGVIQGFRWALFGGAPPRDLLSVSVGIVMLLLLVGLWNFKRMERVFADII